MVSGGVCEEKKGLCDSNIVADFAVFPPKVLSSLGLTILPRVVTEGSLARTSASLSIGVDFG